MRDLLLRVLKFCKSHLASGEHFLDVKTAREVYQCAEFKTILSESQELHHLNLNSLKNDRQKLSFFINLHNLLSIHAHFYLAALKGSHANSNPTNNRYFEELDEKLLVLNDLPEDLHANSAFYLFRSKTEKLLFQQRMCYRVGQMGYVSLYDLKHTVLTRRCMNNDSFANLNFATASSAKSTVERKGTIQQPVNSSSPLNSLNESELFKYAYFSLDLDAEPLWVPYLPSDSICDYKILFALTNCVESDPPICVFNADELLDDQLLMQMKLFLNDSIYANLGEDVLYVPNFLVENCSFFIEAQPTYKPLPFVASIDTSSTKNDLDCLVRFLLDIVSPELKEKLTSRIKS